jgi:hypothetical protein
METISDLIKRKFKVEEFYKKPSNKRPAAMTSRIEKVRAKVDKQYEDKVFNYLFDNREPLGIREVFKLENYLVDGLIQLDDELFIIEIKYRMNWLKACQADWQISNFLKRKDKLEEKGIPTGAIVFFEEFSGDWDKTAKKRKFKNGWSIWYKDNAHSEVDNDNIIKVHLIRFSNGELGVFPQEDGKS